MKFDIQKLINPVLKVRTPLALAGLAMIILYGIYKEILSLNVFDKIGGTSTFLLLQNVLDKLFFLAVLALILGVASYLIPILLAARNKSLSSNISLIDASLDPHDSPYKQTIEDGAKIISYKMENRTEEAKRQYHQMKPDAEERALLPVNKQQKNPAFNSSTQRAQRKRKPNAKTP